MCSTMRIMVMLAMVVLVVIVIVPKRVDSSNNNYLPTTARADSAPYGIDYPTHRPTGRFSNGFNLPDLISERIGSKPTLPYLSPELNGERLLVGANFASPGIGILNDTGIQFVGIIRMFQQFALFEQYQQRLSAVVGAERAKKVVNGVQINGECVPSQLATRSTNGECVQELLEATQIFNPLLVNMIKDLNSLLGADVFVAVIAFLMNFNFITNPQK